MLRAILLGTGSPPPNPRRHGPATLLSLEGECFLVDAGSGVGVQHDPVKPAYGFDFEGGGRSVVVSGDTRPCENLVRWAQGVDCLVHECCEMAKTSWSPGCGWPTIEDKIRDLAAYHTQPDQIGLVAREARAKALVMSHLMPGSDPEALRAAAREHYAGPVVVGEDLMEV